MSCKLCETPVDKALPRSGGGEPRPGDWFCMRCQNVNFNKRHQCKMCNAPRSSCSNEIILLRLREVGGWSGRGAGEEASVMVLDFVALGDVDKILDGLGTGGGEGGPVGRRRPSVARGRSASSGGGGGHHHRVYGAARDGVEFLPASAVEAALDDVAANPDAVAAVPALQPAPFTAKKWVPSSPKIPPAKQFAPYQAYAETLHGDKRAAAAVVQKLVSATGTGCCNVVQVRELHEKTDKGNAKGRGGVWSTNTVKDAHAECTLQLNPKYYLLNPPKEAGLESGTKLAYDALVHVVTDNAIPTISRCDISSGQHPHTGMTSFASVECFAQGQKSRNVDGADAKDVILHKQSITVPGKFVAPFLKLSFKARDNGLYFESAAATHRIVYLAVVRGERYTVIPPDRTKAKQSIFADIAAMDPMPPQRHMAAYPMAKQPRTPVKSAADHHHHPSTEPPKTRTTPLKTPQRGGVRPAAPRLAFHIHADTHAATPPSRRKETRVERRRRVVAAATDGFRAAVRQGCGGAASAAGSSSGGEGSESCGSHDFCRVPLAARIEEEAHGGSDGSGSGRGDEAGAQPNELALRALRAAQVRNLSSARDAGGGGPAPYRATPSLSREKEDGGVSGSEDGSSMHPDAIEPCRRVPAQVPGARAGAFSCRERLLASPLSPADAGERQAHLQTSECRSPDFRRPSPPAQRQQQRQEQQQHQHLQQQQQQQHHPQQQLQQQQQE
ncbi:hypothetical protein DIPPA_26517, partial [Diplonema papillatum]